MSSTTQGTLLAQDLARDSIRAHLHGLARIANATAELSDSIARVAELVCDALTRGNKIMFCGNGGSAADAQHLATEYVVRFRENRIPLAAIALTTDTSLLTAAANDLGFEYVFARQVQALGKRGDILFLHSTSGNSANLAAAAVAARTSGITTVGVLARAGGRLRDQVEHAIIVPTDVGAHAQEVQLAIGHAICSVVESYVQARR